MKRLLLLVLAATLVLPAVAAPKKDAASNPAAKAPATPKDFSGRYERSGDGKSVFILHVRQTGANAEIEFSASRADGTGAAPEGNGTGALNEKGELACDFEDSFGNKGTAVLRTSRGNFQLSLTAVKVAEPRAVKFYGDISLRRTPDRQN
ncbi:MAG: hypothetical protein K8R23_07340 [Chthoniobacter sp.]|nr:hypothetical protein [Chthoniobacter sp.]